MINQAFRAGAFGATGTGKTAWLLQLIAKTRHPRLMVWDYKTDSTLAGLGRGYAAWPEFVRACKASSFQARYLVNWDLDIAAQFEAFCALAWREGNVLVFVDELGEVTRAQKAPPAWKKLVNVGRLYDNGTKSISIVGASQSPAEVDKSFIGNCDVLHCGRLGNIRDAKLFGGMWGVDPSELANLPNLHWIEKRQDSPTVERGVLSFGKKTTPVLQKKAGQGVTKKRA